MEQGSHAKCELPDLLYLQRGNRRIEQLYKSDNTRYVEENLFIIELTL